MTNHILSIKHGAVLEARLNRPEKKNALTGAMYDGIVEMLERASSSNSIRAVLLTAEGRHLLQETILRSSCPSPAILLFHRKGCYCSGRPWS
jgi:hypothetical protein